MNSILTRVFLLSRWERAVSSAIEIASSVDLLGRNPNWSGSRLSGMMVLMYIQLSFRGLQLLLNTSKTKCMLCSKLLVAHVPHPNNLVPFSLIT